MKTTKRFFAAHVLLAAMMLLLPRGTQAQEEETPTTDEIISVTQHPRFGKITVRKNWGGNMFGGWPGAKEVDREFTDVELSDAMRKEIMAYVCDRMLNARGLVGTVVTHPPKKTMRVRDYCIDAATRKVLADAFQAHASLSPNATFFKTGTDIGSNPPIMFWNDKLSIMLDDSDSFTVMLGDKRFVLDGKEIWARGTLDKAFATALDVFKAACTEEMLALDSEDDEEEDDGDDGESPQDEFLKKITEPGHSIPMTMTDIRVPIKDPEAVPGILATFAAPEDFVKELSAAWFSRDSENRNNALQFTAFHVRALPLKENDWRALLRVARAWPDEEWTVAEILIKGGRPEGLEIARWWLGSETARKVVSGLSLLEEADTPLAEEDIRRLVELLKDKRAYIHGMMMADMAIGFPRPLAARVLDTLMEKGLSDRAKDMVLEHLVQPDALAAYDETKFAHFLAEIKNPDLTVDAFWQLVADAGFRLEETQFSDCLGEILEPDQPWDNDDAVDDWETDEDNADLAADSDADDCPPWNESELRNYFTYSPQLAELLRDAGDPRWRFVLVQACFEKRENGESRKYIRNYIRYFAGQNELLPMLDFIHRHPETLVIDEANRNPYVVWSDHDKSQFAFDAILAAMACDLTPDACDAYAEAVRKLTEKSSGKNWEYKRKQFDSALEKQRQKHRAAKN